MRTLADAITHAAGAALLAIACVRLTSTTSTLPYWETDPAIQFLPETTLTPAMSLGFDALTWLLCSVVFLALRAKKEQVRFRMVLAAMVGGAVALLHGTGQGFLATGDHMDLIRGSLWASSMIAAVTLAHLARDGSFKRVCFAVLAGVSVYLGAKGIFQTFVEHPRFVEEFRQNGEQILAANGIEPGSPNAKIFERRVTQPEATGWGGLSNIFGTVVATGALAWLALTILARNAVDRDRAGLLGVTAVAGLVALAGLYFSNSRAAMAFAVVVALAIPLARQLPTAVGRWSIIGLCALAILGVIAQGLLGPGVGDLSLYFRSQYWQGAMGVIADNPDTGVGAGSFKQAFLLHRPPTCPEEVQSPHSLFIDWLAALGLFAIPWIWITLAALRRAGARLVVANDEQGSDQSDTRANTLALAFVALATFAWGAWIEWPTLYPDELFVRAMAVGLWIGAGMVFFSLADRLSGRGEALLWALMAGMVALHSMIEMTGVMPTTAMWALAVVLVAGAFPGCSEAGRGWSRIMLAVVSLAGVVVTIRYAFPIDKQEDGFRKAALTVLGAPSPVSDAPPSHSIENAEAHSDASQRAINMLLASDALFPRADIHGVIATRAGLVGAMWNTIGDASRAQEWWDRASLALEQARELEPDSAETHARLGSLHRLRWQSEQALEHDRRASTLDPWGLEPAKALYETHRELGNTEEAIEAARRLLEVDQAKRLDPLRGLTERERASVEAFLQEADPSRR